MSVLQGLQGRPAVSPPCGPRPFAPGGPARGGRGEGHPAGFITRLANIFRVTVEGGARSPGRWSFYLVDLPGYGYARGGGDSANELAAVAASYFAVARGSGLGALGSGLGARDSGVGGRGSGGGGAGQGGRR